MQSKLLEFLFLTLIILAGTGGELCVSRAMKSVGEVHDFRPSAIVAVILRALHSGWMWAGVGLMATAFFSLLGALSLLNVSFVVPVTALSYVTGACGAMFFLHERVSRRRWVGVCLVAIGVTLVFLGNR
jgi:drug/metabolite transporter (DMT)-like permease